MQTSTLPSASRRTTGSPLRETESVLVVDDDRALCRLVALAVELGGRRAMTAGSAREALELLREDRVALVVTDVNMPQTSGLDLLAALSATISPPPVIVVTGDDDPATMRTALLLGARTVLPKPFGLEELGREIDEALAERAPRVLANAQAG